MACTFLYAQTDSGQFIHKGILSGALTFAVGTIPQENLTNAYMTGNIEYYTDNKISVRGDGYYFFNSLNSSKLLKQNHQMYFGAFYHFPTHSHFDPLIGFQPGVALTQTDSIYGRVDGAILSPLVSAVLGFNYFAEKWFHIQVNARYTAGHHLDELSHFDINELSFSFGLGWNLDVLKRMRKREY